MLRRILFTGLTLSWFSFPVFGDLQPEELVIAEAWEGLYDITLSCQGPSLRDPVCLKLIRNVDFGAFATGNKRLYALLSKKGEAWPFYGFELTPSQDGLKIVGKTPAGSTPVEIFLQKDSNSGAIGGYIRDVRVAKDIKVTVAPMKLRVKRTLPRLYSRKLPGEPVSIDEILGEYRGQIESDDSRLIIRESARSNELELLGASVTRSGNNIDSFMEVNLDTTRGLVSFIQFEDGLPIQKWVLGYRRPDIDEKPWLLGVAFHLRKPAAFEVNLEQIFLGRR